MSVPKVGRVEHRPGTGLPLVVIDPKGDEVVWLSRCLRMLEAEGKSEDTLKAYAKAALRAFRAMWAANLEPATLTGVEYSVPRRWLRHCGTIVSAPPKPSPGQVEDAKRRLEPSTLVLTEAALLTIYDAAVRLGFIPENPVDFYRQRVADPDHRMLFDTGFGHTANPRRIAKAPEKVVVTLSHEDRDRLRNAKRPRDRALWTLLLDSGPRISEALSLTPDTYLPDNNCALVAGKGLGGSRRLIPVTDEAVEAMSAYLDWLKDVNVVLGDHDLIFRSIKAPHDPLLYNAAWKALRRALGNKQVHPHALRHTAATELLELMPGDPEARLVNVQKMLGHKSMATTRRYLHRTDTQVIQAVLEARRNPRPSAPATFTTEYNDAEKAMLATIRQEN